MRCAPQEAREYEQAQKEIERGHFRSALSHIDKVVLRVPGEELALKAARDGARISFFEVKDYQKAAEYNRQIVLSSKDPLERKLAQKQIADIYFTQLNDYSKAIIEINKLLAMIDDSAERAKYKMSVARAYYYQNNFSQAENEANEFLRITKDEKQRFDLTMLKGNIALAQKDLPKAIEIYKSVLRDFPNISQKESVALTLAVCYEENKDYKKAIETLEFLKKTHPMPEYIDVRIKRLQARLKNAPGSRGIRK